MKKIGFIIFIACISIMVSCNSGKKDYNNTTFTNDIDQMAGWTTHPSIIRSDDAHSGKYMCKVDSITPYSFGFVLEAEYFPVKPTKAINVSVWGKWMTGAVLLVASLEYEGKCIAWTGTKFSNIVNASNEWANIKAKILVPKDIPPKSVIKSFMYSPEKGVGYCDDFEITFE